MLEIKRVFESDLTKSEIVSVLIKGEFKLIKNSETLVKISPLFQFMETTYSPLKPELHISTSNEMGYTRITVDCRMSIKQTVLLVLVNLFVLSTLIIAGKSIAIPIGVWVIGMIVFNAAMLLQHVLYSIKSVSILQELIHRNSKRFTRVF